MPPSIDPVENIFGSGISLIQRVLVGFASGWMGTLLSRICASVTSWDELKNPAAIYQETFSNLGVAEVLAFVLWPVVAIYFLGSAPLYAILVFPPIVVCIARILFTDDPILFWTLLVMALLAPGFVFTDGNAWSVVPLVFTLVGLGSGLWWALQYEHGHWVDEVKSWFDREGN